MKTFLFYGFMACATLLLVATLSEWISDAAYKRGKLDGQKDSSLSIMKTIYELDFNRVQVACIRASETIEQAQEACFLETDD